VGCGVAIEGREKKTKGEIMSEQTYLMIDSDQANLVNKFVEDVARKTAIEENENAVCLNCDFFSIGLAAVSMEAIKKDGKIGLMVLDSCEITGSCRRFPPTLPPPEWDKSGGTRFPVVDYELWCGEHRQTHDDKDIVDNVVMESCYGDPYRIWDLNTETGEPGSFVIYEYEKLEDCDFDDKHVIKVDFVKMDDASSSDSQSSTTP
jgi:hypothetical protein